MREEPFPTLIYHPWRHLSDERPHIDVHHTDDLPADRLGETDGTNLVRLRRRQLQIERRGPRSNVRVRRASHRWCPPSCAAGCFDSGRHTTFSVSTPS